MQRESSLSSWSLTSLHMSINIPAVEQQGKHCSQYAFLNGDVCFGSWRLSRSCCQPWHLCPRDLLFQLLCRALFFHGNAQNCFLLNLRPIRKDFFHTVLHHLLHLHCQTSQFLLVFCRCLLLELQTETSVILQALRLSRVQAQNRIKTCSKRDHCDAALALCSFGLTEWHISNPQAIFVFPAEKGKRKAVLFWFAPQFGTWTQFESLRSSGRRLTSPKDTAPSHFKCRGLCVIRRRPAQGLYECSIPASACCRLLEPPSQPFISPAYGGVGGWVCMCVWRMSVALIKEHRRKTEPWCCCATTVLSSSSEPKHYLCLYLAFLLLDCSQILCLLLFQLLLIPGCLFCQL